MWVVPRHIVQHACRRRWDDTRLLMDKWGNLGDRPVSRGGRDGGEDRDSESGKERRRGRKRLWHMREETVVVGRRQLEGTINSPDTSVHITAEHWDRRKAGRVLGAGWRGPRRYRMDRQVLKGIWGIEADRPGADARQARDSGAGGWR